MTLCVCVCAHVCIWYLSYVSFPEFPGSVVCCLSLILEDSQLLLQTFLLLLSLFLLLLRFPLPICSTFFNCPTVLGILLSLFHSFSSFHFSFGSFYWPLFNFTDSFLSYVLSINETIKGIFYFCYSVFNFWYFPLILEFPFNCLYYPCVLAWYPFFHENL